MRYWRHYPKFLQIVLLMLMLFTFMSFAQVILHACLPSLFGLSLHEVLTANLSTNTQAVPGYLFAQSVSSIFRFLLSAVLFACLTHPKPMAYLGLRKPANFTHWFIVGLLLLSFVPIMTQTGNWLRLMDLGADAKVAFDQNTEKTNALMSGTSGGHLLLYLFVFALLPALGEELLFRGVLMRFSYSSTRNIHFAILFSAALFSLAHSSVYNFLPIMLAGILLGYIYYLSGSIWLSIFAHFLNNACAVVLLYLGNRHLVPESISKMENLPWYVLIVAAILTALLFSLLRKKATPLPPNWADDFSGEKQTN